MLKIHTYKVRYSSFYYLYLWRLIQLFHEVNHIKYFKESFIKKFKSIINDIYFNGINYPWYYGW